MPSGQLREVLETEGYSKEYYAVMMKWHKACEKRGYKNTAALMLAESLIDGGHIRKGLDTLEELNVKKLDRRHKQVYYNTLLYAAVCTGDCETARDIYKKASPWLYTASSGSFAASVKHTLGCYEYLQGNTKRAEYLFMQALDSKPSPDVICEVKMALTLCYLDTGRLELAKEQADRAGEYASTLPLKEKLARTRELAEETFRRKLAETA
jgi:tetratricopeptide (TPR) repeat protein